MTIDDDRRFRDIPEAPVALSLDGDKLSPEFQRFITDSNPLLNAFYAAFSGHRHVTEISYKKGLGGKEKEVTKDKLLIDTSNRVMNEYGASKCFNTIAPLVSPLATTSNLTESQIYYAWHIKTFMLRLALLDSYFLEGNPYQLKINHLADITTSVKSLYFITSKAKGGFTLHELADSFITQEIRRTGVDSSGKKVGLIEGIQAGFKGNSK